ncbi:MAG: hypothetical protein ACREO9_09185 [Lysobacterales bacterium]
MANKTNDIITSTRVKPDWGERGEAALKIRRDGKLKEFRFFMAHHPDSQSHPETASILTGIVS